MIGANFFLLVSRLFLSGGKKGKKNGRILHGPVDMLGVHTAKHMLCVCRICMLSNTIRAKHRRSGLPVFNNDQSLARKLDPTLKTNSFEGRMFCILIIFCARKSNCPRRFFFVASYDRSIKVHLFLAKMFSA